MRPYLDGGFLLALLAKIPGTPIAARLLRTLSTPVPINFLHPALALASGATEFYSFDPRPRRLASSHGMKILPEKL